MLLWQIDIQFTASQRKKQNLWASRKNKETKGIVEFVSTLIQGREGKKLIKSFWEIHRD